MTNYHAMLEDPWAMSFLVIDQRTDRCMSKAIYPHFEKVGGGGGIINISDGAKRRIL